MNRLCDMRLSAALTLLLLPVAVLANERQVRFLDGLRERHLFELAEVYCADRLGQLMVSDPARAELTVELIRALSLHAINALPRDRDALWRKARIAAADFLRQSPPHPRAIVVRLQDALTLLAMGELGRQEFEAGLLPVEQVESVRQTLRHATAALEALDKELGATIPLRGRSGAKAGEPTTDELTRLDQQVQHQLARAQRGRAMLFERGTDDRLALLLGANDTLQRLLVQASNNETLRATVQIDVVECQRLLGRYAEAAELAATLDQDSISVETRFKARAELIRVAIAKNDMGEAQRRIEQGRSMSGRVSPELDFAWLEAFVALAKAARAGKLTSSTSQAGADGAATNYERQAAYMAELMADVHGPYWARQVSQLLVASVPRGAVTSVELLSRSADSLYLQGDVDQALLTYDDAAGQARRKGDSQAAFDLAYKAALVEQKRLRHLAAADRLRILANSSRGRAQAAQAHLLAAWNAAQAARSDASAAPLYEELLREHLAAWPNGESADQARIWLGKLLEASSNWAGAIDAYSGVPRTSAHYAAAIAAAARSWRNELARRDAANNAVSDAAAEAIRFFRQAVAGPENRWPERWTDADRTAALAAAEFIASYQPGSASDAEEILRRALAGSPDATAAWRTSAQAQLVVSLAAQGGRQNDALTELRAVGGASTDQMFAVLDRLSRIAAGSGERGRASIANVQLATVVMLANSRDQFSPGQQLTLDRVRADGLAALGRIEEALAVYQQLARSNLDNEEIQRGYARLLLSSADSARLSKALEQWRLVASRAKPRSEPWYEAKYSVALAQFKLGDRAAATALLRYMLQTPTGLQGSDWESAYSELLRKCESGGTKP